jgi:tRNA/tmRNA/rRNA uracil-C5-methylase (TrmA/RlmC/RlmD family)
LNDDKGDRVEARSGSTRVLWGDEHLIERINALDFSMSMSSFFQTNPASAERLYDKVVEYVGEPDQADGVILDLFCGTGTIAQLLAQRSAHEVIGVDLVESAIEDATRNAALNQL